MQSSDLRDSMVLDEPLLVAGKRHTNRLYAHQWKLFIIHVDALAHTARTLNEAKVDGRKAVRIL